MDKHMRKLIYTQTGPIEVVVGRRYHVVVRSSEFGNAEYDATLGDITTFEISPYPESSRSFDFLGFVDAIGTNGSLPLAGPIGARTATIYSMVQI